MRQSEKKAIQTPTFFTDRFNRRHRLESQIAQVAKIWMNIADEKTCAIVRAHPNNLGLRMDEQKPQQLTSAVARTPDNPDFQRHIASDLIKPPKHAECAEIPFGVFRVFRGLKNRTFLAPASSASSSCSAGRSKAVGRRSLNGRDDQMEEIAALAARVRGTDP